MKVIEFAWHVAHGRVNSRPVPRVPPILCPPQGPSANSTVDVLPNSPWPPRPMARLFAISGQCSAGTLLGSSASMAFYNTLAPIGALMVGALQIPSRPLLNQCIHTPYSRFLGASERHQKTIICRICPNHRPWDARHAILEKNRTWGPLNRFFDFVVRNRAPIRAAAWLYSFQVPQNSLGARGARGVGMR